MSRNRIIPVNVAVGLKNWVPGDFAARAVEPKAPVVLPPEPLPSDIATAVVQAAAPEPVVPPVPPEELYRAELEALRAEAREEGFRAGHQAGYAAGEVESASLKLLADHLRELVEDLEQGIANDVLSLALELAKQIVRTSLRVRPDLVLAVIREVSKGFQGLADSPRLILNPADAALVRHLVEADPTAEWSWSVAEDGAIERGGCKFQTGSSEVDATLETRWRRVVASLGRDDAWLDLNL